MAFDRLTDILKLLRSRNPILELRITEASALSRWDQAVGPGIAKHTRPIRVQDSVLWVEVDHPIWKSELHHRKRQILDRLNAVTQAPAPAATAKSAASPSKPVEIITDLLLLDPIRRARS